MEMTSRGADALALQAPDAGLVPVLLVEQREAGAVALGAGADDLGELHRHRAAEEVDQAGGQRVHRGREVAPHAQHHPGAGGADQEHPGGHQPLPAQGHQLVGRGTAGATSGSSTRRRRGAASSAPSSAARGGTARPSRRGRAPRPPPRPPGCGCTRPCRRGRTSSRCTRWSRPATSSLSASGMSKGMRLDSASIARRKIANAGMPRKKGQTTNQWSGRPGPGRWSPAAASRRG